MSTWKGIIIAGILISGAILVQGYESERAQAELRELRPGEELIPLNEKPFSRDVAECLIENLQGVHATLAIRLIQQSCNVLYD